MLQNISKKVTQYFIIKNIVTEKQREICEYILHTWLIKSVFMIIAFSIAIINNSVIETSLFLFVTLSLRRRTGGYHANSEIACFIISTVTTIISVEYLAFFISEMQFEYIFLIYLISVFVLFRFAPINHPNMNMSKKEMSAHKMKMKSQIIIISLVIIIMIILNKDIMAGLLMSGVMLVAGSVIISKIIKQEV